jgi:hypothetical protein
VLVDFQRALADLTASPALCRKVRRKPEMLRDRYDLSDKEWRRLAGIAASKGMEANCMLYRANRLAPVALNLPETCEAIRDDLNRLISAYWKSEPTTDVHFLVEAERFCRFLKGQSGLSRKARAVLAREHAVVTAKVAASRDMARTRAEFLERRPEAQGCVTKAI